MTLQDKKQLSGGVTRYGFDCGMCYAWIKLDSDGRYLDGTFKKDSHVTEMMINRINAFN